MPQNDRAPPGYQRAATAWARYKIMMRWMLLASAIAAILAVAWLRWTGDGALSIHMIIATIAGVGLSVLVGTGLMGLVFLSNNSGHDDDAARGNRNDDQRY